LTVPLLTGHFTRTAKVPAPSEGCGDLRRAGAGIQRTAHTVVVSARRREHGEAAGRDRRSPS
ncbi:hypothetical protein, partial [Streptomyces zingiberis]|uniref:hypothetical protein n=1 Tax=Streptomyces zingiberis TaxID=2053010 RepID=UPI0019D19DE6